MQHAPFNVFIARGPRPDARASLGLTGPCQSCLYEGPCIGCGDSGAPRTVVVALGNGTGSLRCGALWPLCVPSTPGRGTVVISGWVQPLSWDLQFGNELFNSPVHVKEAAPVLPWPYLGQAVVGRALKCEAASSGIAGGKK